MKLIDEKTINEALDKAYDIAGVNAYFASGFNMGADFAEQQLKQKMIDFADYASDFICYFLKGQNLWLSKNDYKTVKTTEQLFEEFINQQK